jgi:hypothetical protein
MRITHSSDVKRLKGWAASPVTWGEHVSYVS